MKIEDLQPYLLAYAEQELNLYSGMNFECPCCKNKRSFAIFEDTNRFYCFNDSCTWNDKGGNIFDLVEIQTGLIELKDKIYYLEMYIRDNGLKPIKTSRKRTSNKEGTMMNGQPSQVDQKEENNPEEVVFLCSKEWFEARHEDLVSKEAVMNQLRFRGFNDSFIEEMNFGFLPGIKGSNQAFNSIVIPFPKSNHFIKWNYNHKKNGGTKYIEAGNKEIFNRRIIGKTERPIFVCEGIFDSLSIMQEGFESVCLCSVDSVDLFIRYLNTHQPKNNLILLLDNDEAGETALNDLMSKLWKKGIIYSKNNMIQSLSNIFRRKFKDINEIYSYSEKSRNVLKSYLNKAEEYATAEYTRLYSKIFRISKTKKKQE